MTRVAIKEKMENSKKNLIVYRGFLQVRQENAKGAQKNEEEMEEEKG